MFRSVIALSSRLCTSSIVGIERFAARNFSVHTIVSKSFVAYRNPAVQSSVSSRIVSTVFERSAVCGNASALVQCRWKGGNKKALKTRQAAAKRFIVTGSGKLKYRHAGKAHLNRGTSRNTLRRLNSKVRWDEAGTIFCASVINANEGAGVYDLRYDHLIDGKLCEEVNVSPSRLSTLQEAENYWDESCEEPVHSSATKDGKKSSLLHTSQLANNIVKAESLDEEIMESQLTNADVLVLYNMLDDAGVTGLTAKGAERVQLLIGMLSSFLLEQQDSFDGSFLDGFTSDTSQSIVSVGNKLLDTMQAVFACFAILLRVQIIMLMDQSVRSSSTLSSEETIELGFRLFHKFITLNLVAPRMSGDDGGKGPRGKVKALDVVTKKRLMLMGYKLLPLATSILILSQSMLETSQQSSRITFLLTDLVMAILKIDPSNNQVVEYVNINSCLQVTAMQKQVVTILTGLFESQANNRVAIFSEILSIMCQIYNNKIVSKLYSLSEATQLITARGSSITVVFAALMTALQSLIKSGWSKFTKDDLTTVGIDSVRECMSEIHGHCSHFVKKLMEKCDSKDLGAEYRQVALGLVEEVLLAVSCPQWPISCILLEHFVSFIVNHLRENDKTAKKDSSHSVYLLDLLGTVTTGVKRYSKQATNEKKQAIDAKIPVALLDVLDKKIFLRKLDWINWLQSGVLGLSQSVMANSPKVSKAEDKMNYTFSVLAEIKNYMFGALLELPPDSLYPEFPIDILQSLITPMEILRRLAPNHDDLIRVLYSIDDNDSLYWFLCSSFNGTTSMASRAATPLSPTTAKKIALDTNENVFHYLLLNWAANALRNKRLDAMKIISNLAQTSQGMNEQKEQTLKKMSNRAAWDYQSPVQVIDRSKAMFHGSLEILLPLYRNLNLDFYNLVCSTGLDSLLFAMGDTVPAVRSKALKILSQAMDIDNDLIKIAVIREAVVTRVADRAISVREEAVKIIGKYVLTKRDDIPVSFLYSLVERLADEGISVRKSSVNCLRELLLSQPNHPLYKELCLKLLERCSMPEEEDTIKEIISSTFQQLWFLPPSETAVFITAPSRTLATYSTPDKDDTDNHRRVISDDKPFSETKDHVEKSISKDSLVKVTAGVTRSRNDKGKALKAIDVHHRATALQLVEFCCLPKAQEWLIMLLRELLHGKGDGDEVKSHVKSRRQNSLDHCANTVKVLVDILLELEEHDHITVDHFTKIGKDYKQAGVDCILTISSICSAQPSLIGHHLPTLLPYLKGDSSYSVEQNNAIKLTIMNILSSSTAQVDSPLKTVDIEEVEQDLFEIAYKGSRSVNIDLAIRCMAEIAAFITNDASRLYSLFTLSFEEIKGVDSQCNKFQDMQATHVNRVMRYIVIAGLVCKHSRICSGLLMSLPENCLDSCDSEDIGNLNERVAMLSLQNIKLSPATISGAGYSLVMFAMAAQISTREMQKAVNNRAVQALCGVFVGCPRLISRPCHSSGLLDELLGPNCETQTQQTFVSALGDLVMIEEARYEKEHQKELMQASGVEVTSNPNAVLGTERMEADSSLASCVLQQQLANILRLLFSPLPSMRLSAISLVQSLYRAAVLVPPSVVPYFLAMLGDNTTQIRRQCTDVLLLENKKRPADLDNRLVDGLVIACEFQYSVHGMAKSTMDQLYGDQAAVSVFNELFSKFLLRESKRTGNFLTGSIRKVNDIMRPIFEEFSDILQSSDASDHSLARSLGSKRKGNNTKQEASVSPAKSIFSGIDGTALALNNLKIADFIAVTISTLQYETMEDPLKIIYFVDNTIGISAIHSVRAYMDLLASVGADRRRSGDMQPPALGSKLSKVPKGDGNISSSATFLNESELLLNEVRLIDWWKSFCTNKNNAGLAMMRLHNLLLHFIDLKCKELMIRMRHYISSYYRISEEQIMFFRPSGTKLGANTDKVGSVEFAAKLALYGNGRTLAHLLREIESLVLTVAEVVSTATTDASKSQELLSDLLKELIKDFNRTASFFYSGPDNFATTAVSAKQIVVDNTAGISTNGKKRSRVAGSPKTRKLQTPKSVEKGMKMRKKQKKLQFHEGEDDDESEEEDYWDGMF